MAMMPVKDSFKGCTRSSLLGLVAVLSLAVCGQGCAEDPKRPPGPPRAAIDACLYKNASAFCAFEDEGHSIVGTCQERGPGWVCVPDRAPPDGRPVPGESSVGLGAGNAATAMPSMASGSPDRAPRPPREAFDACLDRALGSGCLIETPRGEIAGRCADERHGLACIPTDPDHRPGAEGTLDFDRR